MQPSSPTTTSSSSSSFSNHFAANITPPPPAPLLSYPTATPAFACTAAAAFVWTSLFKHIPPSSRPTTTNAISSKRPERARVSVRALHSCSCRSSSSAARVPQHLQVAPLALHVSQPLHRLLLALQAAGPRHNLHQRSPHVARHFGAAAHVPARYITLTAAAGVTHTRKHTHTQAHTHASTHTHTHTHTHT